MICKIRRIVVTIRKHIIPQQTLSCRNEGIGVNKSAGNGVIVSALEVVQPCLVVVDIASVAEGVMGTEGGGQGAGGG